MMCEVQLGGRVGSTCIAAGGPNYSATALEVLLENAKMLLCSTSENGLQLALDALCTRSPRRLDMSPSLLEPDNGTALMSYERVAAEMLLSSSASDSSPLFTESAMARKSGNRFFLQQILSPAAAPNGSGVASDGRRWGREGSERVELLPDTARPSSTDATRASSGVGKERSTILQGDGARSPSSPAGAGIVCTGGVTSSSSPASLWGAPSPMSSLSSPVSPMDVVLSTVQTNEDTRGRDTANFLSKAFTRQVHYLRRRTLLYFLQWDAVPLSVLSCRVRGKGKKKLFIPCSCLPPGSSTGTTKKRGSRRNSSLTAFPTEDIGRNLSPLVGLTHPSVTPLLRRSKRLQDPKWAKKTIFWRELMQNGEELGPLLVLAAQRTLCCSFPRHADIFGKEMWCSAHKATVHTPLYAAYSASGLLLASGTFYHVLQHRERFVLSAVAMHALASAPLSRPYTFASVDPPVAKAPRDWKIEVLQFPLAVSHSTAGADTIDFCVFRIGDALSVVVGISRTLQSQRGIQMQTLVDLLTARQYVPSNGLSSNDALFCSFSGSAFLSILSHTLHVLCQHNLSPTQEYYAAVCMLHALERGLFFDSKREGLVMREYLEESLEKTGAAFYYDAQRKKASEKEKAASPPGNRQGAGTPPEESFDPTPFPHRFSSLPNTRKHTEAAAAHDTAVGCVGCLPFHREKASQMASQEAFLADRVQAAQQKLADAYTLLEHPSRVPGSPTFVPTLGTAPSTASPDSVSRVMAQFIRSLLLLYLSPSAMWYYVASRASVAELLAFRSLEGTAVHSAFWLQQAERKGGIPTEEGRGSRRSSVASGREEARRSITNPERPRRSSSSGPTSLSTANAQYCIGFFRPRVEHGVLEGAACWLQNPAATLEWAIGASGTSSSASVVSQSFTTVFPITALEEVATSPLHGWMQANSMCAWSGGGAEGSACLSRTPCLLGEEVDENESADGLLTSLHVSLSKEVHMKKYKHSKKNAVSLQKESASSSDKESVADDHDVDALSELEQSEVMSEVNGEDKPHRTGLFGGKKEVKGPSSTSSMKIKISEIVNLEDDWRGEEKNILHVMEKQRLPKAFSKRREADLFDAPKCEDDVRELCDELLLCKEAAMTLFYGALV